jgi:FHS family Na+ dependent glucose MFS transporter 1
MAFASAGLILSNLGPVMLPLMDRLHVEIGVMGYVVASRSLGLLVGCHASGIAYDKYIAHSNQLLSGALFFGGALNAAIPLVHDVWTMIVVFTLQGVAVGFMDTGSNLLIMRLHGEAAGPWLQALHTFFCVGAVASPLLVNAVNEFNTAFYIAAAVIALVGIGPLLFETPIGDKEAAEAGTTVSGRPEWMVLILTGAFLFVYVGTETTYGAFILTYSVKLLPHTFSEAQGQFLTAAYWGSMAVGTALAVPISTV